VDALKGVDALKLVPICEGFGADVEGVDLDALANGTFDAIYTAWLAYGVLRFKGQSLDKDSLQTFSQRFGPLEEMPTGRMSTAQKAKIFTSHPFRISSLQGSPLVDWATLRRHGTRT
jgi:taurine dioxygenase